MKKLFQYPVLVLFFSILILFTLVDLIYPDRDYSELENTTLQQRPAFNLTRLVNNQWTADYGNYVKEQFMFRDEWIDLQSRSESMLLQKVELGGMIIGEANGQVAQYTKQFSLKDSEESQLSKNIQYVDDFLNRYSNATFMLVPSASLIYLDQLPAKAPMLDEDGYLDDIFEQIDSPSQIMDLRNTLTASRDEYIFYRTDHHWTTLGAFLAYQDYCNRIGLLPVLPDVEPVSVPEFYGTSYSSSRLWNTDADTLVYYPLKNTMTVYDTMGENSFKERFSGGMYDIEKLQTRDKYAAFLYGNNALSRIEGNGEGKILVIKDSYANCFVPFLAANFQTVDVLDLRSYSYSLDAMIQENEYDQILILYNFQSFKADGYLSALARPSSLS